MMDFRPGDIVECLDDSPAQFGGPGLVKGELYTVTTALPRGSSHPAGGLAPEDIIDLAEAARPAQTVEGWVAFGWRACRFRRVYRRDPALVARLLDIPTAAIDRFPGEWL